MNKKSITDLIEMKKYLIDLHRNRRKEASNNYLLNIKNTINNIYIKYFIDYVKYIAQDEEQTTKQLIKYQYSLCKSLRSEVYNKLIKKCK